ncbi:MAG: hypothetical protein CVU03_03215 [Bacteroidetes bacterium HGW-Bacteroidetes-2]|jgi:hypothetical protein|nr:MAG: hypothetical protein CVU03_03215 [Bacteroidetes bacterium HGW-Bacteroidetes-2]
MKLIKSSIFLLFALLLVISCKNSEKEIHTMTNHEEHLAQEAMEIHLNNNQPWEANIETTQGIMVMQNALKSFTEKEDLGEYKNLKSKLENEFATLVEKCTMTGEAHDQLHNFLMPMKVYFNQLGASDIKDAKEGFTKLEKHLSYYTTYFK